MNEKSGNAYVAISPAHPSQKNVFPLAAMAWCVTTKTPYRDGTTHVMFEPLDFISKLAALVPKPRVNLTRYHGVFAPNSKYRARVTPGEQGKGRKTKASDDTRDKSPDARRASMNWAQRLKRVFDIDVETCEQCGGTVKVIASIEDPAVIKTILDYLDKKTVSDEQARCPQNRAPPPGSLFN